MTILGTPITITDRAEDLGLELIDDFHASYCYAQSPPEPNPGNNYVIKVFQLTAAGPVDGVKSAYVSVNGEAYDWLGFSHFPGSDHGFYCEIDIPSINPSTIIARSIDYDLGNQTSAIGTETLQNTTKLPLGWEGEAYLIGVNSTKTVLLLDNGWYIFFTRSGNTITVEEADIAQLVPPGGDNFKDLIFIPGSSTAWALYATSTAKTEPITVRKVNIDTTNNTLTFIGSPQDFDAGDEWDYLTCCPLPSSNNLVFCTWNGENPDFSTSIVRYSHFNHDTGTTTPGPSYNDEGPSTNVRAKNTDKFIAVYNRNLPSGGPTGIGVYSENFSISGGTITADGDQLQLRNESVFSGDIITNLWAANVQNWSITAHNSTSTNEAYFYQISGGGVPPSGDYDVTHSGYKALTFSKDGAKVYIALQQTVGPQIIIEADRTDFSIWDQVHIESSGTLINVAQNVLDPNEVIFYGFFATDRGIVVYTIDTQTPLDVNPPSLGADVVVSLEPSITFPIELMIGVKGSQKITKFDGATWNDIITSIGFDPIALDALWSGELLPDRVMYGGFNVTPFLNYSPNEGSSIYNYLGPITTAVTSIAIKE